MLLLPVLSEINKHERDSKIVLRKEDHKYIIDGNDGSSTDPNVKKYISVTTWIHSHFPTFEADKIIENMMKGPRWKDGHKYWGMTAEQIKQSWSDNGKNAAGDGENMHLQIECFMNNNILASVRRSTCTSSYTQKDLLEYHWKSGGIEGEIDESFEEEKSKNISETVEWKYFLRYISDFPGLTPYRTEWKIFHEEYLLAGCIDMVYENPDKSLSLGDWKRVAHLDTENKFRKFATTKEISYVPDTNYYHYVLQLNTYKKILEEKYGKKVSLMFLVRLHPSAQNYDIVEIPCVETQLDSILKMRTQ